MNLMDRMRALLAPKERKDETRRAIAAELWLKDEAQNYALAKLRSDTVEQWRASRDPETRERAWLMMHAIDGFVSYMQGIVTNEVMQQGIEDRADARLDAESRRTQE